MRQDVYEIFVKAPSTSLLHGTGQAPNHRGVSKPSAEALEITQAYAYRVRLNGDGRDEGMTAIKNVGSLLSLS